MFIDLPSLIVFGTGILAAGIAGRFGTGTVGLVRACALPVGFIGTTIGLVQMLQKLDDPTRIGPALTIAFLASIYAVACKGLLEFNWPDGTAPVPSSSPAWSGLACILWTALVFGAIVSGAPVLAFLNLQAIGATLCTLAAIITLGRGQDPKHWAHRVAVSAPRAGLFFLYLSTVATVFWADDPSRIGPYLAFGLLSYLYLLLTSLFVVLICPAQVDLDEMARGLGSSLLGHLFGLALPMLAVVWALA